MARSESRLSWDNLPPFLTPADIISLLNCARGMVYNLLQSGEIPSIRIGRAVRVDTRDFVAWVERSKGNPAA